MRVLRQHPFFGIACFFTGIAAALAFLTAYLLFGNVPVAVADPPFPFERQVAHAALEHRLHQQVADAPVQGAQADLVAAAHVYMANCAVCHGVPGQKAALGAEMFPTAPQLWASHRPGVVGVSDDPVGETFWKVQNGIRLSGMPAFQTTLSTNDMWQVSLLLSKANQGMSPAVMSVLQTEKVQAGQ